LPTLKKSSNVPAEDDSFEQKIANKAQPRKIKAIIKPAAAKVETKKKN
jgi:hypothetical protein